MPPFQRLLEEKIQIDQNRNHFELIVTELTNTTAHLVGPLWLNHKFPKSTSDCLENVNKLFFVLFKERQTFPC